MILLPAHANQIGLPLAGCLSAGCLTPRLVVHRQIVVGGWHVVSHPLWPQHPNVLFIYFYFFVGVSDLDHNRGELSLILVLKRETLWGDGWAWGELSARKMPTFVPAGRNMLATIFQRLNLINFLFTPWKLTYTKKMKQHWNVLVLCFAGLIHEIN